MEYPSRMYKVTRIFTEPDIEDNDLISIKDAALLLGRDAAAVSRLMLIETLPEYRAIPKFVASTVGR